MEPLLSLDKIVSLCKRRGFVFQSSEIYGGIGSTWDWGPLGVEFKRNIKEAWWKRVVHDRDDMEGIDAAIIMNPKVWEASGHVAGFHDPFVSCSECGRHFRADHVWEHVLNSDWFRMIVKVLQSGDTIKLINWAKQDGPKVAPNLGLVKHPEVSVSWISDLVERFGSARMNLNDLARWAGGGANGVPRDPCPSCGGVLSDPAPASLMLETFFGPVRQTALLTYLRPETAQGIFTNFENVLTTSRRKIPFGIAQIGKAFRNEITPGNFVFRSREFEQMEMEFFVEPGTDEKWHADWVEERLRWYTDLGIQADRLRKRGHGEDELAHYAKACVDIEYLFPMGWSELEGIANRTDFDLKQHAQHSGKSLAYFDEPKKQHYVPFVIEPSAGVDRSALAFLVDAYHEEQVKGEKRVVLKLHSSLAPIQTAVLPLLRNRPEVVELARKIHRDLKPVLRCRYDDTGSIGRLYRRQDEIGTPFCVTVDVQSLTDHKVTVRHRDSMLQDRVGVESLRAFLMERVGPSAEEKRAKLQT